MFKEIDHIAILVKNTERALELYQGRMKLPLIASERLEEQGIRLTHLDMGNVQLQLVEPLSSDHPLCQRLKTHGEGLHHLCWKVDDLRVAMASLEDYGLRSKPNEPHPGVQGREAAFIEPVDTQGILFEMTSSSMKD